MISGRLDGTEYNNSQLLDHVAYDTFELTKRTFSDSNEAHWVSIASLLVTNSNINIRAGKMKISGSVALLLYSKLLMTLE